jgi:hypothetical protein
MKNKKKSFNSILYGIKKSLGTRFEVMGDDFFKELGIGYNRNSGMEWGYAANPNI